MVQGCYLTPTLFLVLNGVGMSLIVFGCVDECVGLKVGGALRLSVPRLKYTMENATTSLQLAFLA